MTNLDRERTSTPGTAGQTGTLPGKVGESQLEATAGLSPAREALRRLRRDRWALAAAATIVVLFLLTALAPLVSSYDPNAIGDSVNMKFVRPGLQHLFGTDELSRDVLSRVLHGGRVSLTVALLASIVAATLGTTYGAISGYKGGLVDALMMRALDALLSIPRILLLITIAELWGPAPIWGLVVLLGTTGWFTLAKMVRNKVHALAVADFVEGVRAMGAHDSRVLVRHILPNTLSPIIVHTTLGIGNVIVLEAALSFLRVGVPVPHPSWGNIISDGLQYLTTSIWWICFFPGLAIVLTVVAFNVLGDSLRDALDPRSVKAR
jgi:peptide/nickel transport system permease protein